MSRPTQFIVGDTVPWTLYTFDTSRQPVDADSTPTVSVRKNGVAVGDSVTVTKRGGTTGIYDCSYNPASEEAGDFFELVESAVIDGSTYTNSFTAMAVAPQGEVSIGQDDIDSIVSGVGALLTGTIQTVSNVSPTGDITLKKGDDHTKASGNEISLPITDGDQSIYDYLIAADSAKCGLRLLRRGSASDIEGTIDLPGDVTHSNGVTTVIIEFTEASLSSGTVGEYQYDLQRTLNSKEHTLASGKAYLIEDCASAG